MMSSIKILDRGDATELERVIMAELLIPDVPNTYGDIYTRESISEFMVEFARRGYGIDIDHDNEDVRNEKLIVVESFLARKGDPDFIEGSWVVGMKVLDDDLWEQVQAGKYNGFSYEALVEMLPVELQHLRNRQVVGVTSPALDGHVHEFLVLLDPLNRPISGATGVSRGHSHTISYHTVTDPHTDLFGNGHMHRYHVVKPEQEEGEADE